MTSVHFMKGIDIQYILVDQLGSITTYIAKHTGSFM